MSKELIIEKLKSLKTSGMSLIEIEGVFGLPKNSLSGMIAGNRNISKKYHEKILSYEIGQDKIIAYKKEDGTWETPDGKKVTIIEVGKEPYMDNIDWQKTAENISKKIPTTLAELKELCPKELAGFDRSEWIRIERQKYDI